MHFNFHMDGAESAEQTRRIANAVLALGGVLTQPKTSSVGEITLDVRLDTSQAVQAIHDLAEQTNVPPAKSGAVWVEENEPTSSVGGVPGDMIPARPAPAIEPTGLDVKGLPWDERIHSSSRAVNADGTWRYRKNVPDETKREVEAELQGLTQPSAPPAPPVPPVAPIPAVPASNVPRTYSDVVNLIMANREKLTAEVYVSVIGMTLPEFAAACIADPSLATKAFDKLDELRA